MTDIDPVEERVSLIYQSEDAAIRQRAADELEAEKRQAVLNAEAAVRQQKQRQEHAVAVAVYHAHLSELARAAGDVDAYLMGLVEALIRLNQHIISMVPLASKAGHNGAALEQQLVVGLVASMRHHMATYGLPEALRMFFPGRVDGPTRTVLEIVERPLDLLTEELLTTTRRTTT